MSRNDSKKEELQHQLQTLNVLEAELKSLKPDAKVYNAIPTSLKAPLISHAHSQKALFPNLDANSALKDVQKQRKVLLANLQQFE
ncbi:hypothetical protein NDA13_000374 [Ustilago tritici]|nr:hypothetical protein NDA13_000374 [Ustilago tritici]